MSPFRLPAEMLTFATIGITLLGLLVGSFLNVIIVRLPLILQRIWFNQYAYLPNFDTQANSPPFNLCFPASHCLHCKHYISWFDNIPLISFLWLHGHCRHCHQKISLRYPFVELLTCLLSLVVFLRFGVTLESLAGLILTWVLITITFIDIDHKLIPDNLTLPTLWLGLLFSLFGIFQDTSSSIIGAASGYLTLWTVYWIFKWITGKEGMGYGDFKLLAMLGAWLGWQVLPLIILLSSFLGTLVGGTLIFLQKKDKNYPIPFGPFLAAGGLIAMLWGPHINQFYLNFFNQ
jgi:leader peptidase (prepilin peptidase)/N-methyltransferase